MRERSRDVHRSWALKNSLSCEHQRTRGAFRRDYEIVGTWNPLHLCTWNPLHLDTPLIKQQDTNSMGLKITVSRHIWHHRLNGHEFEQTPADGEGQGSLTCCGP